MSQALSQSLDALAAALQAEHQAILQQDGPCLLDITAGKLAALKQVEQAAAGVSASWLEPRLRELAAANQANGALLARRRREVNWTLRQLGRSESAGSYDAHGQTESRLSSRPLAVI